MAGMDYLSCAACGKRLVYDGDLEIRNQLESGIVCYHCYSKALKKIEKLKKFDRRKH